MPNKLLSASRSREWQETCRQA